MDAYDAYRLYLAVKLHFTDEKYDLFIADGRVKINRDKLEGSGKLKLFGYYARELKTPKEVAQFFVANQAYFSDIFQPAVAFDSYSKWKKRKDMQTKAIQNDLWTLIESSVTISNSLTGDPCQLMNDVAAKIIGIETASVINRVLPFAETWKNNIVFPNLWLVVKRLDRFIKCNQSKIDSFIK